MAMFCFLMPRIKKIQSYIHVGQNPRSVWVSSTAAAAAGKGRDQVFFLDMLFIVEVQQGVVW